MNLFVLTFNKIELTKGKVDMFLKLQGLSKSVPKSLWGEAILMIDHLINHLPTKVLVFQRPLKILSTFYHNTKLKNSLTFKKYLGCVSFVYIYNSNISKTLNY